jgi:hypothetical protein
VKLVAPIVALALAGCLSGPSSPAQPKPSDLVDTLNWESLGALLFSSDHDHADRDLHTEIRRGVQLENRSALSNDGLSLGVYSEVDSARGLLAVAVVTGTSSSMRIILLDEAALPALRVVGFFDEPQSYGDVKLDRSQPRVYVPYPLPAVPDGRAFSIWDISRVDVPRRIGEVPGAGCHMLHPMQIGATTYVWCAAVYAAQVYQIVDLPDGTATGVPLFPALPVEDLEVARYASYYSALGAPRAWILRVHDMTFQEDPLTGLPVLVTAHELQGIRIFDVSQPALPRQVSHWQGEGLGKPIDRVHTVGLANIDGRRIAFGATETFHKVVPSLYVVDFTDYATPKFLAEWNPPGVPSDERMTYSMHNFQVVGHRLYVANFHAGLWVLDIQDPSRPTPIALSTPVWDTEYPRPGQMDLAGFRMDQNMYWDVVVANGFVIASDVSAGLEVLRVDGDPAFDPSYRSRF